MHVELGKAVEQHAGKQHAHRCAQNVRHAAGEHRGAKKDRQQHIKPYAFATRGIDVGAKAEIYRLMGELAASGAAVINISMEFQEILGVSDRILVMRQGRVAGELPIAEATADRLYQMAGGEKSEN